MWYKKVKWSVFGSQNEDYSKPIMDSLLGKDILTIYAKKRYKFREKHFCCEPFKCENF